MKKKLILVWIVLMGLAWFAAVNEMMENPKLLTEHLEKAAAYEAQGIYVEAIEEYESALKYDPGNTDIMQKMAAAQLQVGNSKQYVSLCKELIETHPEMDEVLDSLMNYYLEKRDRGAAAKYAAELVKKYPENECVKKWLKELKGDYRKVYFGYTDVYDCYNDTLVVSVKSDKDSAPLYGVTDALGEELLLAEYGAAQPFSESGYALVEKEGKICYVDKNGNTRRVPDMSLYESVSMMNNERVVVCQNGRFGLLDDMLSPETELIYEDITLPDSNLCAAKKDGKWALMSKNGKEKTEYLYDDVIKDEYGIASRQKRVFVKENGVYYIVNSKGERVKDLTFEEAKAFPKEGYAAVAQNGRWGFVNKDGEMVIECGFEDARSFANGYAAICQNGKWGFIDETGAVVIPAEFEKVTDMTAKGTTAVYDGKWKLIQLNLFR